MHTWSYWEHKHWLSHIDYAIIGSGIVGLNCALALKAKQPKAKVVIFEKGVLPYGASTKNAGFACFGSISEILSDLNTQGEAAVLDLVQKRFKGIGLLRETLGDVAMDYKALGGHEVFLKQHAHLYEACKAQMGRVNQLLEPVFKAPSFALAPNTYGFKGVVSHCISSAFEGQIDSGLMMQNLILKVQQAGVYIFNGVAVNDILPHGTKVLLSTPYFECNAKKVFIATNGFSKQFNIPEVAPARAQVLITKPIKGLAIKGTFHLDKGFYYFRNINQRILLGGGRNLAFQEEQTTAFNQTPLIQEALENLLKDIILPETPFKIERRWSGIMGVGKGKQPIVKRMAKGVFCGVRLGGMGIALGAKVGHDLAQLGLEE